MHRVSPIDKETLNKICSDNDSRIILEELKTYIPNMVQGKLSFERGYYRLIDKDIWFSGDNLITRKQMYRRINHVKICDENVENDHTFASYIVFPFIKGNRYSGVNSLRASTGGYNDNPFVFFELLKDMYLCDFSAKCDDCNAVKRAIILTKDYWDLFGKKSNGWECYSKTFGLLCLKELKKTKNYEKYFTERSDNYKWEEYNCLLEEFKKLRSDELFSKVSI